MVGLIFPSLSSAIGLIRVIPPKIRLSIPAGSSQSGSIDIENPADSPIHIKAYLEDWYYLPEASGSKEFKPAGTTELSCANWITFSPPEFTMPPYGKKTINYTVKIPENTSGGHYAILFIENTAPETAGQEGGTVGLAIRVGVLYYIEPTGTIKRTAEFKNLVIEKNASDSGISIKLDFENSANTDLTVGGNFNIMDSEGLVVARGEFNNIYTFPQGLAKLAAVWDEKLPKGKYDLVLTFDLGKALEETNTGRGPIIVKEAVLEIGEYGQIKNVGELK